MKLNNKKLIYTLLVLLVIFPVGLFLYIKPLARTNKEIVESQNEYIKVNHEGLSFEIPKEAKTVFFEGSGKYRIIIPLPEDLAYDSTQLDFSGKPSTNKETDFSIELRSGAGERAYDKKKTYKKSKLEGTFVDGFMQNVEFAFIEDVYNFETKDGENYYFSMEFLEGQSFRKTDTYKYARSIFDQIILTIDSE